MGCSGIKVKEEKDYNEDINKLKDLHKRIESTITENESTIEICEKDIAQKDNEIKQGENDLRQNQYSYSDSEKKAKAKNLFELKQDRQRVQKKLNLFKANNDNLKNNLTMVESKIEEIRNFIINRKTDNIIKEIGNIDTGEILRKNIENILEQQKRNKKIIEASEKLNKVLLGDMEFNSLDDYMEHILKNDGNNDAPVAY